MGLLLPTGSYMYPPIPPLLLTHTHTMNNVTAVMEYIVISSDKVDHLIAKTKCRYSI